MDQISFNQQNQLLQLADSHIQDEQFEFLMETLDVVIETCEQMKSGNDQQFNIKALNFNGNSELTDISVRILTEFVQKHQDIKVLSIERIKASCGRLSTLFQSLSSSRIVELNVSGIPVSYFSIEQLCSVLSNFRSKIDLRVLHLRNTKLSDLSALKLMELIIIGKQSNFAQSNE